LVADVRDVAPRISARAAEIEAARRIPPDLVNELRALGLFRMLVPRSHDGLEIDFPLSVDILAELAAADGATGWTSMIGCETPQLFGLLPRATFDAIYSNGPDVICAGAFAPQGTAEEAGDGYRASGRWGFASGCQHAEWIFGNCVLTRGGTPLPGPAEGAPQLRCMVLPAAQWEILDTWNTAGLRGTGSHDIAIRDAPVPVAQTFDLFNGAPNLPGAHFAAPLLQFALHIGAVALGIAEGAVRELVTFAATGKRRLYARAALADAPLVQYRLGHAEADVQAAGAFLRARVDSYWQQALAGRVEAGLRTQVLQTVAWVVERCTGVVDACYTAGGGSAIYDASPLQRRLRDMHVLTQHASVQENVFVTAGAERLGRTPGFGV
jgi:alkylation response protein AidB-like acyl-CoA dehydrogenase